MAKKIQLEIADPCHESWDNMTPTDKGRFCDACRKQVIDFTNMSDREIALFFKKPSTGSVCGRFMDDQLNRDIEIPKKRIPWVKYFFTIALPAFIASKGQAQMGKLVKPKVDTVVMPEIVVTAKYEAKSSSYNKDIHPGYYTSCFGIKPPPILAVAEMVKPARTVLTVPSPVCSVCIVPAANERMKLSIAATIKPAGWSDVPSPTNFTCTVKGINIINNSSGLNGRVVNENGDPVSYASIMLDGQQGVIADEQGYFSIRPNETWKQAELLASSAGYKESGTIVLRNQQPENLVITLAMKSALPVVVVSGWMGIVKREVTGGAVMVKSKTITKVKTVPALIAEPKRIIQTHVYPNPVLAGGTINIASKELKEGYYSFQLLSMQGQVVHQREVWVDDKATVLNFEVPRITAGNYLLRMIHKNSGESFTEKVLVQ